jgi:ATP-dependent Lon protease
MLFSSSFNKPDVVAVLPLKNAVLFPGSIAPMAVGRSFSLEAVAEAQKGEQLLGVFTQYDPETENPTGSDLHNMGTIAKILKVVDERRGGKTVLLQGLTRVQIRNFEQLSPFMKVGVEYPDELKPLEAEESALGQKLKETAAKVISESPGIPSEARQFVEEMDEVGSLSDLIAANMNLTQEQKMEILATLDVKSRAKKVITHLHHEMEMIKLKKQIDTEVRGEMDKSQKEFYLRKQMEAIRRELGEGSDPSNDVDDFRKRMEEAKLPEEALKAAEKEIEKLTRIPPSSPEYTVSVNYLEWILDLPWSVSSEDHLEIEPAAKILDEDHYGLEKVKKRILEFLAVRKLKKDMKGPILCLIGPPGVGKTSLGKSVARAMGREFVRMSLGGIHDEAEIRGHRRTYIGSMPGRIIQGLKKAGTNNPVFMLDELDKIGADFRGDPSSALLEVLDPEQNDSFADNYMGIPFDLSTVNFIGTANIYDTIPPPLRDRMEIIDIPGYTQEEKLIIAKNYLVKEELENHGLNTDYLEFTDDGLNKIIDSYTREAGVRNLKRNIAAICRGTAKIIAAEEAKKVLADEKVVREMLGPERFFPEVADRTSVPGVATGMAWTPTGGDILFIEATMMKGKGGLILTGKLGDVMKESAKAALSYVRSKADQFDIDPEIFEKYDIHIHVPAGAIPKDGPSAGITLASALTSLLTGRRVSGEMAMTGEVTLRGLILPVGGIKEKILAAKRAGIKEILLPEKNKKDLEEIPAKIIEGIDLRFISQIDEALEMALEKVSKKTKAAARH